MKSLRSPYLWLLCTGILSGLIFSARLSGWILPLLLVPLLHYCFFSKKIANLKQRALKLAYFFVPFYLIVLSWFLDSDITRLAGLRPGVTKVAAVAGLMIMTILMTLCMLPLLYVRQWQSKVNGYIYGFLIIPSSFVVCEWLRSIVFSMFLIGPGASVGDYWNFGSFGLGIINTPAAYVSRVAGLYGLTFVCVIGAVAIYYTLFKRQYWPLVISITTGGILVLGSILIYHRASSSPKQGSVMQRQFDVIDFDVNTPIQRHNVTPKELIILPEYSDVYQPGFEALAERYVNNRLSEQGISIDVDKGSTGTWYGTLEFRNRRNELVHTQTKQLLIPTGEYLPYVVSTFFNLIGQGRIVSNFAATRQVTKGETPRPFKTPQLVVGPVACSGILGRNIYQAMTRQGATVLTNSANLLTFHGSKSYFRESLQMARFHAIANDRTFIQASAGAPSFVINSNGGYVVKPDSFQTSFIDFNFESRSDKTLYTQTGEWVLPTSFIILVAAIIHKRGIINRNERRSRQ